MSAASPVNVNEPAAPSGSVCFSTMMVPVPATCAVLVKVHVTVSSASSSNVAVLVAVSPVLGVTDSPSLHVMSVRSKPSATSSVEL